MLRGEAKLLDSPSTRCARSGFARDRSGQKEVIRMAKEKDCCDIKVSRTKDGVTINVKGKDIEKCIERCMAKCCGPEKE